ncbi:hypothetical protein [Paenibacillus koleovorans]|uniref:hypothetical protein n=1 Tax=Paenibacillus koleovorans TaxID=121608 RepID=UPI000FD7A2D4|nr:hypothetical protein [Paenibacillus koleovorans]
MILYQLTKWMEERKRLKTMIAETEGDARLLLHRKELVERHMLLQAEKWLEPERVELESVPMAYLDPALDPSVTASEELAAALQ